MHPNTTETRPERRAEAKPEIEKFGWPVKDWQIAAGISHSSVYELLKANKLDSVKFRGKRLITTHPKAFLESLRGGV